MPNCSFPQGGGSDTSAQGGPLCWGGTVVTAVSVSPGSDGWFWGDRCASVSNSDPTSEGRALSSLSSSAPRDDSDPHARGCQGPRGRGGGGTGPWGLVRRGLLGACLRGRAPHVASSPGLRLPARPPTRQNPRGDSPSATAVSTGQPAGPQVPSSLVQGRGLTVLLPSLQRHLQWVGDSPRVMWPRANRRGLHSVPFAGGKGVVSLRY